MGSRFSRIPALPRGGQGRLHRARHHHLKGTAPRCAPRWDGHPGRTATLRRAGTPVWDEHPERHCGVGCPTLGTPHAGALRVRPRPRKARGQRVGGDGAPKCPQVSPCERFLCLCIFSGCFRDLAVWCGLSVPFAGGQGMYGASCPASVVIPLLKSWSAIRTQSDGADFCKASKWERLPRSSVPALFCPFLL